MSNWDCKNKVRLSLQGHRQWCRPPIWNRWPPISRLDARLLHISTTVFLKCGPPSGFWPPLLPNPGDGPVSYCTHPIMKRVMAACGPRVWHSWCRDIIQWWRDHRLEFPGLSGLVGNTFCVMATRASNERVFSIDDHVVNSRREHLKEVLGKRHAIFQQCSEKEALKFD